MRPEKQSIINEYSDALKSSGYVLLADYRGLSVEKFDELRKSLRGTGSSMQVVKNGLFALALNDSGCDGLEGMLDGPTAVIHGDGDITVLAKDLKAYRKKYQVPTMKGGHTEGMLLSSDDIEEMANIPPREVLLGIFVRTVAAPMSQLVGVMNQKVSSLLYVLKAIEEKKNS
jgi:large subunit ribosomal protein L10